MVRFRTACAGAWRADLAIPAAARSEAQPKTIARSAKPSAGLRRRDGTRRRERRAAKAETAQPWACTESSDRSQETGGVYPRLAVVASATDPISRKKSPRLAGFLIGAPRFELGTSSPPD